uniref:Transcription factor E2F7 n=1 Tax=Poecilia latipinna TaxID=48699 RepID=A0A3B3U1H4_9TELE
QMEVECLALKDLTSVGKSFSVPKEDGSQGEKENVCLERRRSTPLKPSESSVPVFLVSRKASTSDLAHITPIKCGSLAEPWSPTANLKVLISAASPDIRDREMKKVLFRPMENDKDQVVGSEPAVEDAEVEDPTQEDDAEKKPSRKEKSLGLLCQKFLALYPDDPPAHSPIWISLDEVATNLGVERRRIYDIVNVLESLTIVGRMAKNSYTWYGRQRLWSTLEVLQRRGREQGYHLQMDLPAEARRKDKSLRIMSQKFVMLFLVSKTQTVTLDAAAKVLIEESQDSSSHSKYKTKVRRLYDIANVLTSLELIRKVHVREERARKPAFKWLGPVKFSSSGNMGKTNEDFRKAKMARHSSFTITPAAAGVQRQVSSAPSSPRHHLAGTNHTRMLALTVIYLFIYLFIYLLAQNMQLNLIFCTLQNKEIIGSFLLCVSYSGLNNFNFLIPAGQPAANLSLPPSNVPTMALPYVLVPSAALSHYPLVAGGVQQQQTSDNPSGLRFSLPTMISPAAFMVGTAPHSVMEASEVSVQHLPSPVTPEQGRHHTPHTPKETTASSSKAFFQTPGTLGSVVSAVPAARKRGSAQRRLDVGHSAAP